MLRAAAEVFKEALRMGEPFEAWNERVHGCVLEVAAPALEWHHECGAVPRLTS